MPAAKTCPTPRDLQRYLLGQAEDQQAACLQEHLAACGDCLDTVAHLRAEDTLVAALRAQARPPAVDNDSDEPAVEALIHKLSGLYAAEPATQDLRGESDTESSADDLRAAEAILAPA